MKISTSTYYYKPKKNRAVRDFHDAQLRDEIEEIQTDFPYAGYRTVQTYLFRRKGRLYNGKKIRRIMNKFGLKCDNTRAFVRTTDSDHGFPVYPNLIAGMILTGINQVWVSDITYVRIATGFVYLAIILDVFSRRLSAGPYRSHWIARLLLRLYDGHRATKTTPRNIPSFGQGSAVCVSRYVELLNQHHFRISMSRSGNPYDNAFAESFMKTLKKEEVYLWEYESFLDVAERIPYFIEEVYNRKRVHSGIKYLPPVEFETILADEKQRKQLGQFNLKISGKSPT